MGNIIVIIILLIILGLAIGFIWKEKKSGRQCIGCPSAGSCMSKGCPSKKCNRKEE